MTDDVKRIRVLLVDDHAVVRMGLRAFFDLLPDIDVVGEASDGSEGVAMARRLTPDVVLMDLLMPNMDGVTAIGRIKAELPETEIVTMTSFIEEEKVTAALEAGASGYVLKDAEAEEVAQAIRAAYAGEVHLDPQVAYRCLTKNSDNRQPWPTTIIRRIQLQANRHHHLHQHLFTKKKKQKPTPQNPPLSHHQSNYTTSKTIHHNTQVDNTTHTQKKKKKTTKIATLYSQPTSISLHRFDVRLCNIAYLITTINYNSPTPMHSHPTRPRIDEVTPDSL